MTHKDRNALTSKDLYAMSKQVIQQAVRTQQTLAIAESCTGGYVAKCLTDVPGASRAFRGALVAYDNMVKIDGLNVPEDLLRQYGAVSQPVANKMAENSHYYFSADIAVSITGIAGPGGGNVKKPVGLVYMSLAGHGQKLESYGYKFGADKTRDQIRRLCVAEALHLLGKGLAWKTRTPD